MLAPEDRGQSLPGSLCIYARVGGLVVMEFDIVSSGGLGLGLRIGHTFLHASWFETLRSKKQRFF